jgi:hypothetical protein
METRTDEDTPSGYLFDTVVLNKIADGGLTPCHIGDRRIFVTHLQQDELQNTPDPIRRAKLLAALESVGAQGIPTSSAVFDLSRFDLACWSAEDGVYEALVTRIAELDKRARKRKRPGNQQCDALIAETAIKNNLVFVTDDRSLIVAIQELDGQVLTLEEFKRQ